MQLLIHGGYFKTGTTAFQQWLHASRNRLAGMGIFVPDPGPRDNHGYALNTSIRGDRADQSIWDALAAAEEEGHRHAIVSAEAIASYFPEDFDAFFERARMYDPVLFLVLRHWSEYWPSKYAQDVRRGDWLTLPEFVERMVRLHDRHFDSNFGLPFERASKAGFRRLMAVGYRRNVALEIVAEVTGRDIATLDGGQWPRERVNARPAPLQLDRIRLANSIVGPREGLTAGHTVEDALDRAGKPGFLLLIEVVARLGDEHPALIEEIDGAIAAQRFEVAMADWSATFDNWRDELKDRFVKLAVEDRLGAFSAPAQPPIIETSLADASQLSAALRDRIYEHIVEIRRDVWAERLRNRPALAEKWRARL